MVDRSSRTSRAVSGGAPARASTPATQEPLTAAEEVPPAARPALERMAETMVTSGMQRMAARTFAAVLVSQSGALTSAQLAEILQASPAAVSGSVRYLEQVDMIRRTRPPGSRRDLYLLSADIWYETFAHKGSVLQTWARTMADAADSVGRDTAAGHRLAESEAFFAFLQDEIPQLMDRWKRERDQLGF